MELCQLKCTLIWSDSKVFVFESRQLPDVSIDGFNAPDPDSSLSDTDGRVPGASITYV